MELILEPPSAASRGSERIENGNSTQQVNDGVGNISSTKEGSLKSPNGVRRFIFPYEVYNQRPQTAEETKKKYALQNNTFVFQARRPRQSIQMLLGSRLRLLFFVRIHKVFLEFTFWNPLG